MLSGRGILPLQGEGKAEEHVWKVQPLARLRENAKSLDEQHSEFADQGVYIKRANRMDVVSRSDMHCREISAFRCKPFEAGIW